MAVRIADHAKLRRNIELFVTFVHNGRYCGGAKRTIRIKNNFEAVDDSDPAPVELLGGNAQEMADKITFAPAAEPPVLTVQIHRLRHHGSHHLYWILHVSKRTEGLPPRLSGECDIGEDPAAFSRNIFGPIEERRPPEHVSFMNGVGEKIYERSPYCFKNVYRALRNAHGPGFAIQFICDDPHIPWEFMRPSDVDYARLLAIDHPVGRWILDYESMMSAQLQLGKIVSIAPDYTRHPDARPLPEAQRESALLKERFKALQVRGKRDDVMKLLYGNLPHSIGVIHFAGHGRFKAGAAATSHILLEDADLRVYDIRNRDVALVPLVKSPADFCAASRREASGPSFVAMGLRPKPQRQLRCRSSTARCTVIQAWPDF